MKTTASGCIVHRSDGMFVLQIEDDVSGSQVLEVTMTPTQFASFITATHTSGMDAEIHSEVAAHWGRDKREHQAIVFPFTHETFEADYAKAVASAPEGWVVEGPPPHVNMHRVKNGTYTVSMWRWVPAEITEATA